MEHSHTERRMRVGQVIEVNGAMLELTEIDRDPTSPTRDRVTLRISARRVRVLSASQIDLTPDEESG